jgi:hypothetical protein
MIPVIDHRHTAAEASGTVMMVMIARALLVMRIAWARVMVVVIVVMIMTVLVDGGHDIAGVGREGTAVHADEHAENHDGLEENSHVDAPNFGVMACGSRDFDNIKSRPRNPERSEEPKNQQRGDQSTD